MTSPLANLLIASKRAANQLERLGNRFGYKPEENQVLMELRAAIAVIEAPAARPEFLVLAGGKPD